MKNIAVIGAGISGLAAAYLLSRRHRVQLFEKEARLGGHTNTVLIPTPHGSVPLDTGFLVHNDRTYPNLVRLFWELGVGTRDSDMSFAVSCRQTGLEYSSRGPNGFFAQRQNLVKPSHLFLLREIVRFNREAPALLDAPDAERQTLGDFLESRRFGEPFTHRYLLPMASAIWSASLDAIRSFPALTLIRFFNNHGLLSLHEQPTWKVVADGSHTYIPKLTAPLSGGVHERAEIQGVRRSERDVTIAFRDRPPMKFDEVVFACHGDQVLPLLADPSVREREVLSNFATTTNAAWLHTDASVLPVRPRARASWNYLLAADAEAPPMVTYDLNRLQGLRTPEQVLRHAQSGQSDRRTPRAAPVRLSPPVVYPRGDRRAAAVARGQRHQPHALLRRLLVPWLSRGWVELRSQGRRRARGRVVIDSGLFVGTLRHRRFTPVAHAFTYPLFMALLDVDRLPELMRVSRVTSYNRWNWASFDDRDHLGDPARALRDRLAVDATRHGIDLPDGRIFLLTHLRYLGYGFNPVSFFYCFDAAERLQAVLAEVSNTFGGSHNYWLRPDPASRTFRAAAVKLLYVSPFMPVDLDYAFAFTPPARRLIAHMETVKAGAVCFDATLSLDRRPWSALEIRRALVRYPAMTANVVAGIHWQALKLWWKGVPLVPRVTSDGVGERAAWDERTVGQAEALMER